MKAMRAAQFGGPELLRLEDAPDPQLKDGHVLIRVKATGINPADLVRLSGRYPQALPLPYIPGTDVAGEVEAVGAGVTHVKIGDRVFGRSLNGGGYAQKTVMPAVETIPLPDESFFRRGSGYPRAVLYRLCRASLQGAVATRRNSSRFRWRGRCWRRRHPVGQGRGSASDHDGWLGRKSGADSGARRGCSVELQNSGFCRCNSPADRQQGRGCHHRKRGDG